MQTLRDQQPSPRKREEHLSKDGKWRSFPKVPHLLQYVISGNYFGKVKINGKSIRKSLETDVWSTAQLRLNDFLKEQRENRNKIDPPKFSEAVEKFKQELDHNTAIKDSSKQYRLWCLGKLEKTWPELWKLRLNEITPEACKQWSAKLVKEVACHYYNNTLGTLKQVLQTGIKMHKADGGGSLENPAADIKKTRIKQKDLRLPEPAQFKDLVANVRKRSGGWGPRDGDLVEFLAYSGMRTKSEAVWVTGDDIDWVRKEIIVRGHPETATKNGEIRRIPIISDMQNLLTRMKEHLGEFGKGPILQVSKCNEALARACNEIGIQKLTHHDLRHLFATRCIESGVDRHRLNNGSLHTVEKIARDGSLVLENGFRLDKHWEHLDSGTGWLEKTIESIFHPEGLLCGAKAANSISTDCPAKADTSPPYKV